MNEHIVANHPGASADRLLLLKGGQCVEEGGRVTVSNHSLRQDMRACPVCLGTLQKHTERNLPKTPQVNFKKTSMLVNIFIFRAALILRLQTGGTLNACDAACVKPSE